MFHLKHALAILSFSLWCQPGSAENLIIDSGIDTNGDDRDDSVRFLLGPVDTGFPALFAPPDFQAAQQGPLAFRITSGIPSSWISGGSVSGLSNWIGTAAAAGSNGSALYAVPFELQRIGSVCLNFSYAIDNGLGDPLNQGLFINGIPVNGLGSPNSGSFTGVFVVPTIDITDAVHFGENWLYIYQYDWGVFAGAQFTATITAVSTCEEDIAPVVCKDGVVGVEDLLIVIGDWGPCADPRDCRADITGNGTVNVDDLLAVINAWGPCS